jgi:hypothetical protein
MKCRTFLVFALVSLAMRGTAVPAGGPDCFTTFYQTKDTACIDAMIATVRKQDATGNQARSVPEAAVGFLAQIFRDDPQQEVRILTLDASPRLKSVYLAALFRAGKLEDAKIYAEAVGWPDGFKKYSDDKVSPLNLVKPLAYPGENDLLIGAYMASGNTEYVTRILANYKSADDRMASDAIRVALMNSKFGPTLTPPGRESVMAAAVCERYQCKANPISWMRVMTLASGLWAVRSLAQRDEGIKRALVDFFKGDQRIQQLSAREDVAFGNYLTMVIAYAAIKDNSQINESLSTYEKLGTPEAAANALKKN